MFNFVPKTAIALTLGLMAFSTSPAQAGEGVSDISVEVTLAAPQGSNALDVYPTMAADLERALLQRVDTTNDPSGPTIHVDIRKLSLDGDTILPDTAEFNELEGFLSYQGGSREVFELIRMSARTDDSAVPAGVTSVAPDQTKFYEAMLTAFADRIISALPPEDIRTDG